MVDTFVYHVWGMYLVDLAECHGECNASVCALFLQALLPGVRRRHPQADLYGPPSHVPQEPPLCLRPRMPPGLPGRELAFAHNFRSAGGAGVVARPRLGGTGPRL